ALQAQGKLDEAIACYRNSMKLDPKSAWVHNALVSALSERGWGLANNPDPKIRDLKRAVELGKEAVELTPNSVMAWGNLGRILYRAGHWKESVEAFEKCIELSKSAQGYGSFFLAMAYWQSGKKEEAHKHYEHAVQWFHTNDPHNAELGRLCTETEGLLGIFAVYQQAVLDTPRSAEAHNRLGRFLLRSKGDTEAGLRHLREAIRLDPELIATA